jgi:2-dehydropantoate 2-reductase
MKFLVYGVGAIGGYIGGSLANGGHEVAFIARPAQAEVLNSRGLTLRNNQSQITNNHIRSFTSPVEALTHNSYDCLILALKAYDTDAAIAELKAAGKPVPPILCLQNGVDNEPKLREAFGLENVIAGTVLTAVANPEPGVIVVEKSRGVGLHSGHPLSEQLVAALRSASVYVKTYANAEAMKWTKLLTNILANATAAICDLSTEAVYAHPGLYRIEIAQLREAIAVMDAKRLPVVALPRSPTRELDFALRYLPPRLYQPIIQRAVGRGRGDKKPSFHQDLSAGKQRTEVTFLNGAVACHAEGLGLRTPVNRMLTEILESIVTGRVGWEEYRGKPENLVRVLE